MKLEHIEGKTGPEMPEQADLEQILFSLEWVENGEVQVYGERWDVEESEDEDFTPEKTPWAASGRTIRRAMQRLCGYSWLDGTAQLSLFGMVELLNRHAFSTAGRYDRGALQHCLREGGCAVLFLPRDRLCASASGALPFEAESSHAVEVVALEDQRLLARDDLRQEGQLAEYPLDLLDALADETWLLEVYK